MPIKYETEFTDEKLKVLTDYSMNYNKKTVWLVIIYRIIGVFLGCYLLIFASIIPDASVVYYILALILLVLAAAEGLLMKKSVYSDAGVISWQKRLSRRGITKYRIIWMEDGC